MLAIVAALLLATPGTPPTACERLTTVYPNGPGVPGGEPGCAAALAEACDAGRRRACFELGDLLESDGPTGRADPPRALALHRRACAAGVGPACTHAAALRRAAGDRAGADALASDGCALGDGAGCLARAEGEPEPARAARLRERACDLGAPAGCAALAREAAGVDPARARELLVRACRLGAAEACPGAAAALREAPGSRPDAEGARALLERGCELGEPEACARLGLELLREGRPGEAARGGRLLAEHCAALGADACLDAAAEHLHDPAAVLDDAAPPALVEAACGRGRPAACARLGRLLQEGRALPADGPRSAALYRRACEAGVARACSDLGVLHRFGAGVPRDEARARRLFERACVAGEEEACRLRDDPVRPAAPHAP